MPQTPVSPTITKVEAQAYLLKHALLIPDNPLTVAELSATILHISQLARIPKTITDALVAVAALLHHIEIDSMKQQIINAVTEGITEKIEVHLMQFDLTHDIINANMTSLHSAINNLEKMKSEQKTLLIQQHSAFQQSLVTLENTTAKASHPAPSPLTTATSYRDALINTSASNPPNHPMIDPQVTQHLLMQSKQVLIDLDNIATESFSLAAICDLANEITTGLDPPTDLLITIDEVTCLRNGAILLQLNSKEAADWVHSQKIRTIFTEGFAPTATIKERGFPIMIPAVPFSFCPNEPSDLRETEECNRLPEFSVLSARWLKPPSRQSEDQMHGHCVITLNSAENANKAIRDSITIAGKRVCPSKFKKEPLHCLRCQ